MNKRAGETRHRFRFLARWNGVGRTRYSTVRADINTYNSARAMSYAIEVAKFMKPETQKTRPPSLVHMKQNVLGSPSVDHALKASRSQ